VGSGGFGWFSEGGTMGERAKFTPEEWRTLQFAPFWMFSAVVGGYRRFDPLELDAFMRSLHLAALAPGRLSQEVIESVTLDLDRIVAAYERDDRTIASGLCQVAALLHKVPADEAEMFRGTLVAEIGEGIARARGRFGRLISEEDAKTVELVAQFLA
jgi:hypothetical protein